MPSRDFYFLRHGETDWNAESRLQGHTDIHLNENGRTQAQQSITALQKIGLQRIISSPLERAHETARIINKMLNVPLHLDERLKEKHFGIYEGKTTTEIEIFKKEYPDQLLEFEPETGFPRPPGAEVYGIFHERIFSGIKENLEKYPNEKILFVSHGGVYRVLCRHFFGKTDHSPNATPFHFSMDDATWQLKKIA